MANVVHEHISKTPDICGGKACIAGHRIRVMDIVALHEQRGYSPDEIVDMFPAITLADVHAALVYYFDHRAEIESDFKHDADLAASLRQQFPSKLQEKLRG
jgi:uncharacterized protein (DUF433 family)